MKSGRDLTYWILRRKLIPTVFFCGLESKKLDKLKGMNRNRVYIVFHLLIVLGVIASFRFIEEKQRASIVATSLFLIGALNVLSWELRHGQWKKSLSFYATLAFLILFIIPIIYLRVASWNGAFELESILGITGAQFHQASNKAFMVMIGAYFIQSILDKKKPSK